MVINLPGCFGVSAGVPPLKIGAANAGDDTTTLSSRCEFAPASVLDVSIALRV